MFKELCDMPTAYFSALWFAERGGEFLDGVCYGLGVPAPPNHPTASFATAALAELSEHPASLLAAMDVAMAHASEDDRRAAVWSLLHPVAGTPASGDGTEAPAPLCHYEGTVDGKRERWRSSGSMCRSVTWFYGGAQLRQEGHDCANSSWWISNHVQHNFSPPCDTDPVDFEPDGFYNMDANEICPFPARRDTAQRWESRVSGVIDALLARGASVNGHIKRMLPNLTVRRYAGESKRHGACALCRLPRTRSHIVLGMPDGKTLWVGSTCAAQVALAIDLSMLKSGSDPAPLLSRLEHVLNLK